MLQVRVLLPLPYALIAQLDQSNGLLNRGSRVRVPLRVPCALPTFPVSRFIKRGRMKKPVSQYRGVAQLAERRSPKPCVECSNRSSPAISPGRRLIIVCRIYMCSWRNWHTRQTQTLHSVGSIPTEHTNCINTKGAIPICFVSSVATKCVNMLTLQHFAKMATTLKFLT